MLGTAAILLLFVGLIGRGLRIALDREDAFGRLLATGLTTTIALLVRVSAGPWQPARRSSG
jgi:cell division protein FtsW (lipid II flippase)